MSKSSINDSRIYSTSLSAREVALLSDWARARRVVVTIDDIRQSVGARPAAGIARQLVQKQALQRVRRGIYLVRPLQALGRPSSPSTAVAAEALLQTEPHYLGGLWAVSFHRLSEQRYAAVIDAFVTHQLAARRLGAGRVRFHVLKKDLFSYGISTVEVEGLSLQLSDRERTVLDALDHPRLFGGLPRALELAEKHLRGLEVGRLVRYAVTGSRTNTCQRLGVLLVRAGASARAVALLRKKASRTHSLLSMNPGAPRKGRLNREWGVVENDL